MIKRIIEDKISQKLNDPKAIIILGPRQVGKSTLLHQLFDKMNNVVWWNGDEADVRSRLENPTSSYLRSLIGNNKILLIDEAQRILNIGIVIKLITDNLPDIKVVATGSSSFDLANKINEPLTGRKWEYFMFPIAYAEMVQQSNLMEERRQLEHRMIFGYYPDIINNNGNEIQILKSLSDSYLYKDLLTWERLQKPEKMEKLVQALAFQIGNEVSYHELGKLAGLDNETVEKYIQLLERAFIVFRLPSLSRNLRTELKKSRKIYFYDNGIRNALINQFNPLELRSDSGALWENFIISERLKYVNYNQLYMNRYFWRTTAQQEIDYIEDFDGIVHAYECKWKMSKKVAAPKTFSNAYPNSTFNTISPDNFEDFVLRVEK